jgi:hypothetical protein
MNRDDIIRMAREAGCTPFRSPEYWDDVQVFATPDVLEQFANLVAAAEREAFDAKYPIQLTHDQYNVVINAALKDEREACAKVAEDMGNISGNMNKTWRNGCFDAAFAIRERGAP